MSKRHKGELALLLINQVVILPNADISIPSLTHSTTLTGSFIIFLSSTFLIYIYIYIFSIVEYFSVKMLIVDLSICLLNGSLEECFESFKKKKFLIFAIEFDAVKHTMKACNSC